MAQDVQCTLMSKLSHTRQVAYHHGSLCHHSGWLTHTIKLWLAQLAVSVFTNTRHNNTADIRWGGIILSIVFSMVQPLRKISILCFYDFNQAQLNKIWGKVIHSVVNDIHQCIALCIRSGLLTSVISFIHNEMEWNGWGKRWEGGAQQKKNSSPMCTVVQCV